jgi:hypothetical protein
MESALKFKIGLTDFMAMLNQLKFTFVGKKNMKRLINCRVTVKDGELELEAHGYMFRHKVNCKGGVQFSIPFPRLQLIVGSAKELYVVFVVRDGTVEINNTSLNVTTTFFRNLSPIRKIALAVNSTDKELLLLPHSDYTKAELDFNKLMPKINRAKERLSNNIAEAYSILEVYGVTLDDIATLVDSKLYKNIQDLPQPRGL